MSAAVGPRTCSKPGVFSEFNQGEDPTTMLRFGLAKVELDDEMQRFLSSRSW
jgi:hypothetical protein